MDTTSRYPVVMLIDDNELDNFVNKKLIENEKFSSTVIVHQSAQEALDNLRKMSSSSSDLPSIIFLDIMMPNMDGFAFLDEFEKLSDAVKEKCKIVMLSTTESFKDLNRANKNRFVYKFLNKPLVKPVLDAINL